MKRKFPDLFALTGLIMLIVGALAGVLISMVYLFPDALDGFIPFNRLRPLHTSAVVSWIILTAVGGVYYYLRKEQREHFHSDNLGKIHFLLWVFTGLAILISLITGKMGGREYLEFSPVLIVPILLGWVMFGYNYFKTMVGKVKNWPVYYWMWGTGIVFMIIHLSEANFWMFEHFRRDFIRDMTVQWKSYGSFVGSWNMLVYGTAIYLMTKLKQDESPARGWLPFFFYFLGFSNLMFGWAHHTYILPTLPWVRYVAYAISMTEWIIFVRIMYLWSKSLGKERTKKRSFVYRFLIASDIWVFLNLFLALLMSIPALNFFTHGTHVTVAHSMGTTIGINTMILLASLVYQSDLRRDALRLKRLKVLYYMLNVTLFLFWFFLISMGLSKAWWLEANPHGMTSDLHRASLPWYVGFVVSGVLLCIALLGIAWELLRVRLKEVFYVIYPSVIREELDRLDEMKD